MKSMVAEAGPSTTELRLESGRLENDQAERPVDLAALLLQFPRVLPKVLLRTAGPPAQGKLSDQLAREAVPRP